jgi:hypothetical protein
VPTTPVYALPFPSNEDVATVPADMEKLALRVAELLATKMDKAVTTPANTDVITNYQTKITVSKNGTPTGGKDGDIWLVIP